MFFFNDTATTEIYTLSLHDALPISDVHGASALDGPALPEPDVPLDPRPAGRLIADVLRDADEPVTLIAVGPLTDRKSTRLNSSHANISYAVFCLKKKPKKSMTRSDC